MCLNPCSLSSVSLSVINRIVKQLASSVKEQIYKLYNVLVGCGDTQYSLYLPMVDEEIRRGDVVFLTGDDVSKLFPIN